MKNSYKLFLFSVLFIFSYANAVAQKKNNADAFVLETSKYLDSLNYLQNFTNYKKSINYRRFKVKGSYKKIIYIYKIRMNRDGRKKEKFIILLSSINGNLDHLKIIKYNDEVFSIVKIDYENTNIDAYKKIKKTTWVDGKVYEVIKYNENGRKAEESISLQRLISH